MMVSHIRVMTIEVVRRNRQLGFLGGLMWGIRQTEEFSFFA